MLAVCCSELARAAQLPGQVCVNHVAYADIAAENVS